MARELKLEEIASVKLRGGVIVIGFAPTVELGGAEPLFVPLDVMLEAMRKTKADEPEK